MRPIGPLVVIALSASTLEAQDAWFTEVPTAAKVVQDYQASESRLGAARAAAALYSLTNLIGSVGGATAAPAAQARVAELLAAIGCWGAVEALRRSIPLSSEPRLVANTHCANAMSSLSLGRRDAAMDSWRALSGLDTSSAREVGEAINKNQGGSAVGP